MRSSAQKKSGEHMASMQGGFSLIELLIVVAIILIIAAIAIPNMLRSRMAANQATAVANVRTVTSASVSYSVTYSNGYPPLLSALGGVEGTPATCNASILIDPILSTAPYQKTGYQFNLQGNQGNVAAPPPGCTPGFVGYLVTAAPMTVGLTGNVSYCSDESGVLHYDTTGATPATAIACNALPNLQ
jgi:type IV pilus assembly protein PilA